MQTCSSVAGVIYIANESATVSKRCRGRQRGRERKQKCGKGKERRSKSGELVLISRRHFKDKFFGLNTANCLRFFSVVSFFVGPSGTHFRVDPATKLLQLA